jgi:hypothetical protein
LFVVNELNNGLGQSHAKVSFPALWVHRINVVDSVFKVVLDMLHGALGILEEFIAGNAVSLCAPSRHVIGGGQRGWHVILALNVLSLQRERKVEKERSQTLRHSKAVRLPFLSVVKTTILSSLRLIKCDYRVSSNEDLTAPSR